LVKAFTKALYCLIIAIGIIIPTDLIAEEGVTYSLQVAALAPNAGGQQAYALRRSTDEDEWFLFSNNYLETGKFPLTGAGYNWRFPICDQDCFWQFYVEVGGGISTAGPMAEVIWGMNFLWVTRLDIGTHFYLTQNRLITWSYPLWAGISVPL
jgi:hypothetical protein